MTIVMAKIKKSNQGDLNQDIERNKNKWWRQSPGWWCEWWFSTYLRVSCILLSYCSVTGSDTVSSVLKSRSASFLSQLIMWGIDLHLSLCCGDLNFKNIKVTSLCGKYTARYVVFKYKSISHISVLCVCFLTSVYLFFNSPKHTLTHTLGEKVEYIGAKR